MLNRVGVYVESCGYFSFTYFISHDITLQGRVLCPSATRMVRCVGIVDASTLVAAYQFSAKSECGKNRKEACLAYANRHSTAKAMTFQCKDDVISL